MAQESSVITWKEATKTNVARQCNCHFFLALMFFITLQLMHISCTGYDIKLINFYLPGCMSTTHETVCIFNFKEGVADGKKHDKDDRQ